MDVGRAILVEAQPGGVDALPEPVARLHVACGKRHAVYALVFPAADTGELVDVGAQPLGIDA